jgi:hypothetical protein
MNLAEIKHRDQLPEFLNRHGLTGTGVEIGVFEGNYSDILLKGWKGHHLFGVDPFENLDTELYHDGCNRCDLKAVGEKTALRFKDEPRYKLLVMASTKAAGLFDDGVLDFVHIDGNHEYYAVQADMAAWWGKVKHGGLFTGHDAYNRDDDGMRCGVARAVIEFSQEMQLPFTVLPCTTWVFEKL